MSSSKPLWHKGFGILMTKMTKNLKTFQTMIRHSTWKMSALKALWRNGWWQSDIFSVKIRFRNFVNSCLSHRRGRAEAPLWQCFDDKFVICFSKCHQKCHHRNPHQDSLFLYMMTKNTYFIWFIKPCWWFQVKVKPTSTKPSLTNYKEVAWKGLILYKKPRNRCATRV